MNTSPWNKDRIIGQKRPLQISHIWGIRIRVTNGAKVIHIRRLKSDPGVNLLS